MGFTKKFSDKSADYAKVRAEHLSLVNAVSGFGETETGIALQWPSENLTGTAKTSKRLMLLNAHEIVSPLLGDAQIIEKLKAIAQENPIHRDLRRQTDTLLNPHGPEFDYMLSRVMPTITAAVQNFRRDVLQLLEIYDGFTQPGRALPKATAFHCRAAFAFRDVLEEYRRTNHMPMLQAPSLNTAAREQLTRYGVDTRGIADAGTVKGILHEQLPANVQALREAARNQEDELQEVRLMLRVLQEAVVRGDIPPLQFTETLREGLRFAVLRARQTVMPGDTVAGFQPHQ
jgi:hypothetical protein